MSTSMPIPIARPPIDIILIPVPVRGKKAIAASRERGMDAVIMHDAVRFLKKKSMTMNATRIPAKPDTRRSRIDSRIMYEESERISSEREQPYAFCMS